MTQVVLRHDSYIICPLGDVPAEEVEALVSFLVKNGVSYGDRVYGGVGFPDGRIATQLTLEDGYSAPYFEIILLDPED